MLVRPASRRHRRHHRGDCGPAALRCCCLCLGAVAVATADSFTTPAAAANVFNVRDFGAKGDGATVDSAAIEAAFAACRSSSSSSSSSSSRAPGSSAAAAVATAAGATVLFPAPGRYVTGPWRLDCNDSVVVVEPGAAVVALNSTARWPLGPDCPEPSQGKTARQAAPFVLAEFARNVTLTGGGELDARGRLFWDDACGNWWCPAWDPNASAAHPYAWRPFMLRIDRSSEFIVTNLSFVDPGFWCIVPTHSDGVTVSHVNVTADPHSPNTDGIEPMWSSRVHVSGAYCLITGSFFTIPSTSTHVFDTKSSGGLLSGAWCLDFDKGSLRLDCHISNGDDCITVKSGSRNVLVERVSCQHSHGLTVGSVWYDDVTNVTYRDCVLSNGTAAGPRIKGRRQGNATVSQVSFVNITVEGVGVGIEIDLTYETPGSTKPAPGVNVRDVLFQNVHGTASEAAASLTCLPGRPCNDSIRAVNVDIVDSAARAAAFVDAVAGPAAGDDDDDVVTATAVAAGVAPGRQADTTGVHTVRPPPRAAPGSGMSGWHCTYAALDMAANVTPAPPAECLLSRE